MASPFVIALRGALALLAAAPPEPGEAGVARKIVREIEQSLARFEGKEASESDLISIVCHDLKDPLASIVMGAGFLRKTVSADDGAARRVVDAIARSTDRMSQVIGDFHDLAKLEAGRIALDLRPCDVTAVLHAAIPTFESRARERGVRLELEVPQSPLVALSDRARLLQVVAKLVGNAIKFTSAEGSVVVRAEDRGEPYASRSPTAAGAFPPTGSLRSSTTRPTLVAPRATGPASGSRLPRGWLSFTGARSRSRAGWSRGASFRSCCERPARTVGPNPPARWAPPEGGAMRR